MSRRHTVLILLAAGAIAAAAWLVVLPWYADRIVRTKVSEVFSLLGNCEPRMAEQLGQHKKFFAADAKPSDCGLPAASRYVSAFRVSGGRVEARLQDIHPDLDGKVAFAEALQDKSGDTIRAWRCGMAVPEAAKSPSRWDAGSNVKHRSGK